MKTVYISLLLLITIGSISCVSEPKSGSTVSKAFGDYWYKGKAEITSYKLEQARYGQINNGHAVLVFVTEDFSHSKQVKLDHPQSVPEDAVKVLKLNATRKFLTGFYPYSIMTSVFSPVDFASKPNAMKLTFSSQEWCGHVYTQANHRNGNYEFSSYSYFESEGDEKFKLDDALLEDELFTKIRLAPDSLPTGDIKIIPSLLSSRLKHFDLRVEVAAAEKVISDPEKNIASYRIKYKNLQRTVSIDFANKFPYEILGWSEEYKSGFGPGAKLLTTIAVKNKSILLDYWNKNSLEDVALRKQLGL
ncbi:MAG: hypothetical protein GWO07_12410 [Candidatus Dadabacteria bacterium]|nr:hypothetical protein [Candidatus Dadabacteria bacterium]NIS09539.1 hypothetical protein [Candidatus Dadabacteria bacterium]NIV42751.1 hypothetical protein [Candidatus Dadabacteria bacterium]NIX16645.1 hypothetical protein [Candidatus Dadabacteria bacterium]NIY23186.1 hypothetical protein [Candidatus Dadabacteria bacterium]